jgi:cyclophilin family peptidyl-prolyl cis-trans isomerase
MVLGIVWLGGIGSILALIFGLISKKQIDESAGRQGGRGMSIAGVTLGSVGIAGAIIWIIFLVSLTNTVANLDNNLNHSATTATNGNTGSINTGITATTESGGNPVASSQTTANSVAIKAGCPAGTSTRVNTQSYPSAPAMTINVNMNYSATVVTTVGTFTIALDAKSAPITVNNFVFLADHGYYHCVIFHRVIPGFMDQTGDPTGTGTGGPGYTIPDENPPATADPADQYPLGSVAMANTSQPNTGGSQFFIVAGSEGESLPNTYALFGNVTTGMNVVETINAEGSAAGVPPDVTQRMLSVKINES